jgi:CheY-like chemotaxis protein
MRGAEPLWRFRSAALILSLIFPPRLGIETESFCLWGFPMLSADLPLSEGAASSHRVLIVDDNRDAARLLAMLIESDGPHQVRMAHSGEAAIAAAAEFAPEVVLLDIGLPDISGYEVAQRLRATASGESIYLVALTGYSDDDDLERSRAVGFDRHLVKPIDTSEIQRIVRGEQRATNIL